MKHSPFVNSKAWLTFCFLLAHQSILTFALSQEIDEKKQREKLEKIGRDAVREQFATLRADIKSAGETIGEDGRYLLSTDIVQLRDVDKFIIAKIEGRKEAIKRIIWTTAADIEAGRNTGVTFQGTRIELSAKERERVDRLNKAIQDNNVSLGSLALAIKMVVEMSNTLYKEALSETISQRKSDLYIEYTAFAYELSSIVVEALENFHQQGVDDLRALYAERKQEIDQLKGRINNMKALYKQRLDQGKTTKVDYDQKIKTYDDLFAALDVSLKGWEKIFGILDTQKDWAEKLKNKTDVFRDLRDDAGLQLDVLREVKITMTVLSSIKAVEDIADFAQIPLLPINADLVKELLGLDLQFNPVTNKKESER